jgi:Ala-tRNA(Pro) deacylase
MQTATPEDVYACLDALGIIHKTVVHSPVFTVEESRGLKARMPGGHTKNLFLKDKKGALYLLCAISDTIIDLNAVSRQIGAGRFSFGAPDLLMRAMGVTPGSVTLFALLNDPDQHVRLILDQALFAHDQVNFHPLRNDLTTAISPAGCCASSRRWAASPSFWPSTTWVSPALGPSAIEPTPASAHIGANNFRGIHDTSRRRHPARPG